MKYELYFAEVYMVPKQEKDEHACICAFVRVIYARVHKYTFMHACLNVTPPKTPNSHTVPWYVR